MGGWVGSVGGVGGWVVWVGVGTHVHVHVWCGEKNNGGRGWRYGTLVGIQS